MRGILRVIPPDGSVKAHRIIVLRQAPAHSLLTDILGGPLDLIASFDTILYKEEAEPCYAFRTKKEEARHNTFASMLWFQAQLRATGWSGVKGEHPTLLGPVIVLFGEPTFRRSILEALLFDHLPRDPPPELARSNQED